MRGQHQRGNGIPAHARTSHDEVDAPLLDRQVEIEGERPELLDDGAALGCARRYTGASASRGRRCGASRSRPRRSSVNSTLIGASLSRGRELEQPRDQAADPRLGGIADALPLPGRGAAVVQRPPRRRHLLVGAAQHAAIERRLQRAVAPGRGDLQMSPARLGQDLSQRRPGPGTASRRARHDRPPASLRTSAAAGSTGTNGPSPPSAIRDQLRRAAAPSTSIREAAAVGAEAAQALGDRRQARRERRQRAHQAQPHQPS